MTGAAKAATHVDDATAAVRCFAAALPDPRRANAVVAERPFSLVGAAALWAGWSSDLALLRTPVSFSGRGSVTGALDALVAESLREAVARVPGGGCSEAVSVGRT